MKSLAQILSLFLIAALLVAVGWFARGPRVVYETEVKTVTQTDTLVEKVYGEPVIIKETAVVRDTVYITGDTITKGEVAKVDSTMPDGARVGFTYEEYSNDYELRYDPAPRTVEYITKEVETIKTVELPRKWWDKPALIAFAALALGLAL